MKNNEIADVLVEMLDRVIHTSRRLSCESLARMRPVTISQQITLPRKFAGKSAGPATSKSLSWILVVKFVAPSILTSNQWWAK